MKKISNKLYLISLILIKEVLLLRVLKTGGSNNYLLKEKELYGFGWRNWDMIEICIQ